MEHERVESEFDAKEVAVHHVMDHYDPEQLFQGLFDDAVIRHYGDAGNHDVTVSQFVKDAGVTLEDVRARRAKKRQAVVDWLTPVKTRAC